MNFNRPDLALLVVRLVVGSTFIAHGAQKLFGWFGGPGMDGWLKLLSTLGVTHPIFGYLGAGFEFFGGILVLIGFAAKCGALAILGVMLGAIYLVHLHHGYFLPNGMEYSLNLALLCVAIILGGSGAYSVYDVLQLIKK